MLVAEDGGELLEPVGAAGDEDEVVPLGGKTGGEACAEAGGRAGDQVAIGHV